MADSDLVRGGVVIMLCHYFHGWNLVNGEVQPTE